MWAKHKQDGFTIVELLIVIVVIAILAAITIVAYNGIRGRAIAASLQSDLDNASKKLKLFQVDNGAYPTTNDCSASPAVGSICLKSSSGNSYTVFQINNTSNPQSFCLTAVNSGTNTYTVDNNSQPTKGVCLTNIVTNGDFSNGTAGWAYAYIPTAATDSSLGRSSLKFIATNTNPFYVISLPSDQSHYWYSKLECYVSSYTSGGISALDVRSLDSGGVQTVYADNAKLNQWQTLSSITTGKTGGGMEILVGTGNNYATATFYISNVSAIDLTAAFGAGNEPTKAQMDTIMSSYPNSWFNGTAKVSL